MNTQTQQETAKPESGSASVDMICKCGSLLSAVTYTCVRGKYCSASVDTTRAVTRGDRVSYVSEQEWNERVLVAEDRVKLGRLRAYLRPILAQQAKNVASAAAHSISDFEAMKRATEMLNRIESEEA